MREISLHLLDIAENSVAAEKPSKMTTNQRNQFGFSSAISLEGIATGHSMLDKGSGVAAITLSKINAKSNAIDPASVCERIWRAWNRR